MRRRSSQREKGQAMVEYVIVLAVAILVLTTGDPSPIQRLANVIRSNWIGYSYALSLSDLPDAVDMTAAQVQYAADGKPASLSNFALNYNAYLSKLATHIGNLPEHCKSMPVIRLRQIKNGPLGLGGGPPAPDSRC